MGFAGVIIGLYLVTLPYLFYLWRGLSSTNQALVLASALGSLGTLALALATFVNISLTNEQLQLQTKERQKPLAVDELSYVIQPAIDALEDNLQKFDESEYKGCTFEWVYISSSSMYAGSKGPKSVKTQYAIPAARMASEDRLLYQLLGMHEQYVEAVAEQATQFHEELKPEINRLLEEHGLEGESSKAVSTAVLRELDEWGEEREMYDFWEQYRDHLIDYADSELEVSLSQVQQQEQEYRDHMEATLERLISRKMDLTKEYSISEDEIQVEAESFDLV